VNYGVPADYDELARHGVSVRGAIVLARYGGSWRGIKPKVAAEHGAVGCLIFSDPRDDGYAGDSVFPNGPMRPREGVQRGSVADMPVYPGDPLTPGVGATANAKRLDIKDAKTITKIPVLPISYGDAEPLLAALGGPVAPEQWRGGLPLTYRLGGSGPARAHLVVKSDWSLKPLYDVIARLPGTSEADEWVIRGNHHDAWVNGAEDPISRLVAELEEARALGTVYKSGWRPKRTIIYAAWDGEEPGLLGSTEWAETHADELRAHAVAYLNSDTNDRGLLGVEGSHTLERLINDVARDVDDPEAHTSVWKREAAAAISQGGAGRTAARASGDLPIGALGSGSDFTPFLQHLGIASLNLGFGGEDDAGIYHSIYDDFYWYTHFSDTSFVFGRALAQVTGTAVMRLADADLLPFRFSNLSSTVTEYVHEIQKLRDTRAEDIAERNRQRDEGTFAALNDPRRPTEPPPAEMPAPQLEFAALLNAADSLEHAAARYETAYERWSASNSGVTQAGAAVDARTLTAINAQLLRSERLLTAESGLPGRPWYQHLLYAPGLYTGYGVKTMPGAREAIEQGQWVAAESEMKRIAAALDNEAALVSQAAVALAGVK
jgi:N-acetylated-alpha-linked acidic dipeptidase